MIREGLLRDEAVSTGDRRPALGRAAQVAAVAAFIASVGAMLELAYVAYLVTQ